MINGITRELRAAVQICVIRLRGIGMLSHVLKQGFAATARISQVERDLGRFRGLVLLRFQRVAKADHAARAEAAIENGHVVQILVPREGGRCGRVPDLAGRGLGEDAIGNGQPDGPSENVLREASGSGQIGEGDGGAERHLVGDLKAYDYI